MKAARINKKGFAPEDVRWTCSNWALELENKQDLVTDWQPLGPLGG